jgi:hypothetical protein
MRKFNHQTVLKYVVSTVYIASGIIMFAIFLSNVTGIKAQQLIQGKTSATYIDCMNCDEID